MDGEEKNKDTDMDRAVNTWTDRLCEDNETIDRGNARRFVRSVYTSAQDDLREQSAQAEYEREE